MLALLFTLLAVHAQTPQEKLAEDIVASFTRMRRMNSPQSQPPVAFLVRQRARQFGDDVTKGLIKEGLELPETLFQLKLDQLAAPALTELFSQYSAFMNFVREKTIGPRYAVLLGNASADQRERLLRKIATIVRDRQIVPLTGNPEPVRNTAFLVEVEDGDLIANGLSVKDLQRYAEYSVDLDGYRLDFYQGFRLKVALDSCAAAVQTPDAPTLAYAAPPTLPRFIR